MTMAAGPCSRVRTGEGVDGSALVSSSSVFTLSMISVSALTWLIKLPKHKLASSAVEVGW